MTRTALIVSAIIVLTVLLLPVQGLAILLNKPSLILSFYHRVVCKLLGVRVQSRGEISIERPLLVVANHISWLDIIVISTLTPAVFVAKSEVASWPLFGWLAKLQRSIFVDRGRRQSTRTTNRQIASRMLAGDSVVLFAEGTSSNGQQVLPFRSALVGAAGEALLLSPNLTNILVQPVSIAYTGEQAGMVAWYGDMDLMPHIGRVLRAGRIDVVVSWGEPIAYSEQSERKAMTKQLESRVRSLLAQPIDRGPVRQRSARRSVQNARGILG